MADEILGGSIGAGLFVASGGALQSGGPGSLVICYAIIGVMILCTVEVQRPDTIADALAN